MDRMEFEGYLVRTVAEEPALADQIQALSDSVWPAFIVDGHPGGDGPATDWMGIYGRWPHLQAMLFDLESGAPLAAANACSLAWDDDAQTLPDTGWSWEMATAVTDLTAGRRPRTLGALAICVHPAARGRGLSALMLRLLKDLGRRNRPQPHDCSRAPYAQGRVSARINRRIHRAHNV